MYAYLESMNENVIYVYIYSWVWVCKTCQASSRALKIACLALKGEGVILGHTFLFQDYNSCLQIIKVDTHYLCFLLTTLMCKATAELLKATPTRIESGIVHHTQSFRSDIDEGLTADQRLVLKVPKYQDKLAQRFLKHLLSSPKFDRLYFSQNYRLAHLAQREKSSALAEDYITKALRERGLKGLEHTVRLQVWGNYANVCWKDLSGAAVTHYIETVINRLIADTHGAELVATKYAQAVSKGNYGVILDDEADDLLFLLLQLEDGIIPKFLIPYGGFTELRYQSLMKFVNAACKHYNIPPEKVPKVYRGFPHLYIEDENRHPYDYDEGFGYIPEAERVRYMEQSQELEKALKDDAGKAFRADAWDHPTFKEGLDALRNMIDKADYTAIAVLTSPAPLTHLLEENPERAKKVGVTMASPWCYSLKEDGVLYSYTYNSGINLKAMKGLLKSGADFIGVGGGTAKTRGMRTVHDYRHGSQQAGLYPDVGIKNLEKVISTRSSFRMFKIIAHAGENMTTGIWRVWDQEFSELWKFLGIEEIKRPGLKKLRQRSGAILALIEKEEVMRRRGKVARKIAEGFLSVPESGVQSEGREKAPQAASWGLDKVLTLWKIWYLWGNVVQWQAASADLHAIITSRLSYVEDILGAIRYKSEAWNDQFDTKEKPYSTEGRLDKLKSEPRPMLCPRMLGYSSRGA
ncbi:uncharacterized protein MELLADRAFT_105140 [Melampsora larici-populina 98AG31]|uniref:Uncharacterized protein n=1 Tax=Melampsora larici-populina (strain 98AG31 / pathotype 3-4-7) TaxID=747676 RepID=F4RGR8_MELLP|nr:uncharacterized protein MELLADRAFT_105140 [Melampsora larici-populina 98AG31]EGG08344.1 hypothetical protein MELLADRAFT_105140 [Melampsora larici-populina 98AG31]